MSKKILITYLTQSGSTREIAQAIQKEFSGKQIETDLADIKDVKNLSNYRAVVLGLPLYMFHWPSAGTRFLNRHRKSIEAGIPVALFSGGPTEKGDKAEWKTVNEQIRNELNKVPWFKPASLKGVGGKLDPLTLAFPWKLIPAMRNLPVSDLRDWEDIRNWANQLTVLFSTQE